MKNLLSIKTIVALMALGVDTSEATAISTQSKVVSKNKSGVKANTKLSNKKKLRQL